MGCCGERENFGNIKNEQKWDYINLDDFHSQSCGTPLSYGFLAVLMFISIGVYAVDLYTACNLLFFDRWSGQVQPVISLHISRWVFAGCIILSWVLLAYRLWRAIRAIKSDSITKSYLDPLAVRLQSMRMGEKGRGWRRFLVFAALTKGRKGAEYVALFTYFTFEAWLRIVFAEGPRQVINALTLYSVLQAKLIPVGEHAPNDGHSPIAQFFVNLSILAGQNREQATILFGMLFTLIIWAFSALSLLLAVIFYVLFLWHHIPSADGNLSKYCRRKIEKRLHKIVMQTVNTALAKGDKLRAANDLARPGFAGTAISDVKRQPTLPSLDNGTAASPLHLWSQQHKQSDIASFISRPESHNTTSSASSIFRGPTIPDMSRSSHRPDLPSRQATQSSLNSHTSYGSDAPLLSQAGGMGLGGQGRSQSGSRPNPTTAEFDQSLPRQRPLPDRTFSAQSASFQRPQTPQMGPPRRQYTDTSVMSSSLAHTTLSHSRSAMSRDPSIASLRRPMTPLSNEETRGMQEFEMHPPRVGSVMSHRPTAEPVPQEYIPYNPYKPGGKPPSVRSFGVPFNHSESGAQLPLRAELPERSGTAPLPQSATGGRYDSTATSVNRPIQPPPQMPVRPATAGPAADPRFVQNGWGSNSRGPLPATRW